MSCANKKNQVEEIATTTKSILLINDKNLSLIETETDHDTLIGMISENSFHIERLILRTQKLCLLTCTCDK